MSQSLFPGSLGAKRALDARVYAPPPKRSSKTRRQELEVKLAALQQDYAELHTAIFEAAEVHRRLCAPRLVRHGSFEIASEIFAVRHLPGDFFTIEEKNQGVILALGDICGKGLAAGMWTTHLVGLLGSHTATTSEPEAIVAGVNHLLVPARTGEADEYPTLSARAVSPDVLQALTQWLKDVLPAPAKK